MTLLPTENSDPKCEQRLFLWFPPALRGQAVTFEQTYLRLLGVKQNYRPGGVESRGKRK